MAAWSVAAAALSVAAAALSVAAAALSAAPAALSAATAELSAAAAELSSALWPQAASARLAAARISRLRFIHVSPVGTACRNPRKLPQGATLAHHPTRGQPMMFRRLYKAIYARITAAAGPETPLWR